MRVAMYVFNDCRTDARVLREAAALAAAGHQVTVVARLDDPAIAAREDRDGFEIVRLPVPTGPHNAWALVRYPWRARRPLSRRFRTALRRGPAGTIDAGLALAAGLVALGWSVVLAPVAWTVGAVLRATGRPPSPGGDVVDWLVRWRWGTLGWARAAASVVPDADIHHGHDLSGLPAAVDAASRHGLAVYDSHELFLESRSNATRPAWLRRRFGAIEAGWIRRTVAVVTVNDALARELARRYPVPRILAIHNCPPRWDPPAEPEERIRRATGIPVDAPIALYHGTFSPYRGLEQLAEAILEPGLERVHAVYLGYGSERRAIEALATERRFGGRLHVLGPVPPEEVVPWVAGADVDVMALQPSTLNHILSTPNKLFEALAAGTPVVASDFPELRRIVADDPAGPLGELCDPSDPRAVAASIRAIVSLPAGPRAELRARCLTAAHERWNWETEAPRLVGLYDDLARDAAGAS